MAVPLPHAPPSSGMHPCAAPCTQRHLGAETPWSRKPKVCPPPLRHWLLLHPLCLRSAALPTAKQTQGFVTGAGTAPSDSIKY